MSRNIVAQRARRKKSQNHSNENEVRNIHVNALTFDELFSILRRLHFWAGEFAEHAESTAMFHENTSIGELTRGLEEERFMNLTDKSLEIFEHKLIYGSAVDQWRAARALDNHKFKLLETVENRFPEHKPQLKYFYIRAC